MDEQANAVVDLLRTMGLTIMGATLVCDRAKMLIQQEPLAKKDAATQVECVAANGRDN